MSQGKSLPPEVVAARQRSFTTQAVIVFVLYWAWIVPGLIANQIFLNEANRVEEIADQDLPGVGALRLMRTIVIYGGLAVVLCFIAYIIIINAAYYRQ